MKKNEGTGDLFGWTGPSLREASEQYWGATRDEGAVCPCCKRFGKVYRRKLNSGMAWWLIRFYRHCQSNGVNGDYVDVRSVDGGIERAHKCEFEKLAYWGLLEKDPTPKEEGHASGFWRLTELGYNFVKRGATVQSHALDYNGGALAIEGDHIGIRTALGRKFDYDELMEA